MVEKDGEFCLRCDHSYFFQVCMNIAYEYAKLIIHLYMQVKLIIHLYMQVQCQVFCTQRSYCDFVVWAEKDVHIQRIYPD